MSNYNTSPLKWAGGKGKALNHLLPILEKHRKPIFVEPFVGDANVSLNFDAEYYIWNDLNRDLMGSYRIMLDCPDTYLSFCEAFFNCGSDAYTDLRKRFNSKSDASVVRAALFQYLNKHGFNGLCRYNSKGSFNVPVGTVTTKPKSVPEKAIRFLNERHQYNTTLYNTGFDVLFKLSHKEELIYSDPPYVPLTSDFKYTAEGFGKAEHELLKKLSKESTCTSIISNHWAPYTEELYSDADEIHLFDVQRTISCDGGNRKKVQECVVVYLGE
ncbi:DNA adenine methylase [Rheinheimera phage vB_RspM_Barba10S]|uniref:site-specific DNA-methyltransferase (adenine-specific) n=1 Tax=Rheinheimera phage vB_RspM_Barba10S TaxID=2565645 RepID=A0A4P8N2Z8_9CAUD|nr:DNA adenine methylase [Rheinheimera phage vB_RspM_Barba10S]